jgi:hypothetical protein
LITVQTPGEGNASILTLAWAGAVWFGLWRLEQGDICLHIGVWNLLAAWGLIVYHRLGANVTLLDVYLLPVGLYLISIGHLSSRREQGEEARALWWAGLLLILTPAYLAYWEHAAPWHTLLLIGECLAAVLWGIAQHIRAFVCAGLGFAAAFGASVTIGRLPEVWGTLAALLVGVGLFIAGFYALTHREIIQSRMAALEAQWRSWQAWR